MTSDRRVTSLMAPLGQTRSAFDLGREALDDGDDLDRQLSSEPAGQPHEGR
ncbi:hypothetical protein ACIBHX_13095 [Nonomuraea sp. NPDC050536]|uniref:hypothetical protein n=1 Tax=Nonomuraea sp. NPDC050536 TaxID=3364366 RepID=UPI0037C835DB